MPIFTPETARKAANWRHSHGRKRARAQAADLQLALHSAGMALSQDVPLCTEREERARVASALASVAKGWQSMNDQLRIMNGTPMPGSLRPAQADKPKRAKQTASVLPAQGATKLPIAQPVTLPTLHPIEHPIEQPANGGPVSQPLDPSPGLLSQTKKVA